LIDGRYSLAGNSSGFTWDTPGNFPRLWGLMRELPILNHRVIPKGETAFKSDFDGLLLVLFHYRMQFAAALALFDSAPFLEKTNPEQAGIIGEWRFIAARDSAMSIYHVGRGIEAIRASMKDYPLTRQMIDHDLLRAASKEFEKAFPSYLAMRHAIAHNAENMLPSKRGRHAMGGDGEGALIQHHLDLARRQYGFSFNGEYVATTISNETFQTLTTIVDRVYSAFSKLT
jgi:hypothetical protein